MDPPLFSLRAREPVPDGTRGQAGRFAGVRNDGIAGVVGMNPIGRVVGGVLPISRDFRGRLWLREASIGNANLQGSAAKAAEDARIAPDPDHASLASAGCFLRRSRPRQRVARCSNVHGRRLVLRRHNRGGTCRKRAAILRGCDAGAAFGPVRLRVLRQSCRPVRLLLVAPGESPARRYPVDRGRRCRSRTGSKSGSELRWHGEGWRAHLRNREAARRLESLRLSPCHSLVASSCGELTAGPHPSGVRPSSTTDDAASSLYSSQRYLPGSCGAPASKRSDGVAFRW
jgi:hypothetical protein